MSTYHFSANHQLLLIYTLIVDGRKLSVGTKAAFRNLIDLKGISLQEATDEDIETLAIHPGTPLRVRQQITAFIQSRKQRSQQKAAMHPARQQRLNLLASRGKR